MCYNHVSVDWRVATDNIVLPERDIVRNLRADRFSARNNIDKNTKKIEMEEIKNNLDKNKE